MDGDFNVVIWERGPAALNQRLCRLRPRAGTDHRFIAYVLPSLLKVVNDLTFSTTVKHLSSSDILGQRLPAPSSDEQRRIADFLDAATAHLDTLAFLRERQVALAAERFAGSIDAEFDMPSAPLLRLRHLLTQPLEYGAGEAAEYTRDDWPRYVRTTDVAEDGSLRPDTFRSLPPAVARPFMLADGDLLFTRSGATVGKSFLYAASWGPCAFAGYLIRARFDHSRVLPRYVADFCQSRRYWSQVREGAVQSTIQNVNAERYGNLALPVPDLDTQRATTARVAAARATHRTLELAVGKQLALLAERRQALITAAVTGQLDVTTARGGVS